MVPVESCVDTSIVADNFEIPTMIYYYFAEISHK